MKIISICLFAGMPGCAFVEATHATEAAKVKETVLYYFCSQQNCADGQSPLGGVLDVNGTLYGTTAHGGAIDSPNCESGCGAVYSLDPDTGAENVLYSFCIQQNCADGAAPIGNVVDVKGTLYGTTNIGGAYCQLRSGVPNGCGTVFSLDPNTGTETVLHSFGNGVDGVYPNGGLTEVSGQLYGTTFWGGTYGYGSVFAVDRKTGAETVLYSFCSQQNCQDGANPGAGLIDVKGLLYGTTTGGGNTDCPDNVAGCGVVFALDPSSGTEKALYTFCQQQNCTDGAIPQASLIDVGNTLYGTTPAGGANNWGTVFTLNAETGAETVLHSFCNGNGCVDGSFPEAGLINVNGTLYGTTPSGGAHNSAGTIFSIDPDTGAEMVRYSFCSRKNCIDGKSPYVSLIAVKGALYGTTSFGGISDGGVVFALNKIR